MPRPRDCRANRSCSSASELSSQAAAPSSTTRTVRPSSRYEGRVRMRFDRVRTIGQARRRRLEQTVDRDGFEVDHEAESIACHTLIVTGSSLSCINRYASALRKTTDAVRAKRVETQPGPL